MNLNPGYLTPDDVPEDRHCRLFKIPNSEQWLSVFMGAILPLVDPESWQKYGDLSPQEAADAALDVLWAAYSDDAQYCNADVDAPYWESAANVADESTPTAQPWYGEYDGETFVERLEDFALAGFIAYSGNIGGAVTFLALAPQFRLAWKSNDLGGIVRVLLDAVEIGRVDTYSASPAVVTFDVFRDPDAENQQLLVVLDDETNPDIAGDPSMSLVRKRLDPEEISNPDFRYDPECDCVQQTGDGGTTWVDSPANDVRHADAWRLPPIVADDPKCQAAANMTRFFSDWLEGLSPILSVATNAWSVVSILIVAFVELGPFALVLVALDVAATLLGIGAAAIDAAFTNTVFDTLTCIFYCNIDADGQVSADQLAAINSDIDDQIGGVAAAVLHVVLAMVGEVGLSNWGARGDAPADCDACGCAWCYTFDFTVSDGGWAADTYGTWVPGEGWQVNPTPSALMIGIPISPANSLESMRFSFHYEGVSPGVCNAYYYDGSYHAITTTQGFFPGDGDVDMFSGTTTIDLPNIYLNVNADDGAIMYIRSVTLRGEFGVNPFGADNC